MTGSTVEDPEIDIVSTGAEQADAAKAKAVTMILKKDAIDILFLQGRYVARWVLLIATEVQLKIKKSLLSA